MGAYGVYQMPTGFSTRNVLRGAGRGANGQHPGPVDMAQICVRFDNALSVDTDGMKPIVFAY